MFFMHATTQCNTWSTSDERTEKLEYDQHRSSVHVVSLGSTSGPECTGKLVGAWHFSVSQSPCFNLAVVKLAESCYGSGDHDPALGLTELVVIQSENHRQVLAWCGDCVNAS